MHFPLQRIASCEIYYISSSDRFAAQIVYEAGTVPPCFPTIY